MQSTNVVDFMEIIDYGDHDRREDVITSLPGAKKSSPKNGPENSSLFSVWPISLMLRNQLFLHFPQRIGG